MVAERRFRSDLYQRLALVLRVVADERRIASARLVEEAKVTGRTETRRLNEMMREGLITCDGRTGRLQGYRAGCR